MDERFFYECKHEQRTNIKEEHEIKLFAMMSATPIYQYNTYLKPTIQLMNTKF